MKQIFIAFFVLLFFTTCRYFTYTPRSKKKIHRERPSALLLDRIIDFRLVHLGWPVSKADFMSKGIQYRKAFEGFRYNNTEFKRIDSNQMIFFFYNHDYDIDNYAETGKTDLNRFNGRVKFYKENGKFMWKIKMH